MTYIRVDEGSVANMVRLMSRADATDRAEGMLAYNRYKSTISCLASKYGTPLDRAVAAFVSLSPNNDYVGNLRSAATLFDGIARGVAVESIRSSSYRHCLIRAHAYATGRAEFLTETRGPKIRAFYMNIIDPANPRPVTIDGHMVCAWLGRDLPMKQALLRGARSYDVVANATRDLAGAMGILPNQVQAILWFTRKRVARVRFDGQNALFGDPSDRWGTFVPANEIKLYEGERVRDEHKQPDPQSDLGGRRPALQEPSRQASDGYRPLD